MTTEEIKHSIDSKYLKLNFLDIINHYGVSLFFLSLPILYIFFIIQSYFTNDELDLVNESIWFVGIFTIVGVLFIIIQRRQLRFKYLKTSSSEIELASAIKKVCDEKEWAIYEFGKNYFKVKTFSDLFTGSFGEDITIIFDENLVLINSKCKLSKRNYLFSNPNTQNINAFFERIKANN